MSTFTLNEVATTTYEPLPARKKHVRALRTRDNTARASRLANDLTRARALK